MWDGRVSHWMEKYWVQTLKFLHYMTSGESIKWTMLVSDPHWILNIPTGCQSCARYKCWFDVLKIWSLDSVNENRVILNNTSSIRPRLCHLHLQQFLAVLRILVVITRFSQWRVWHNFKELSFKIHIDSTWWSTDNRSSLLVNPAALTSGFCLNLPLFRLATSSRLSIPFEQLHLVFLFTVIIKLWQSDSFSFWKRFGSLFYWHGF